MKRHNSASEWREKKDRFPADSILRRHGWTIAARPERGPTLWRLGEEVLPENVALQRVADEVAEGAK